MGDEGEKKASRLSAIYLREGVRDAGMLFFADGGG